MKMTSEENGLGSEVWAETTSLQGQDQLDRANRFKHTYSASSLLSIASRLRDSVPCTLDENFSIGQFNFVKKITFEDDVEWIARMRMPPPAEPDNVQLVERGRYAMSSEIATMEYIREHTNVPIPKIHAFSLETADIGVPYILLDYVHGTVADEMASSLGSTEGFPEQFEEKFMQQYAWISAQLASLTFSQIGSVVHQDGEYRIGPAVETGSGPYDTSSTFYEEYPDELIQTYFGSSPSSTQRKLPDAFKRFAGGLPQLLTGETFRLVNFDLAPNNILVDSEFNILSVIDWDAVMAVPEALTYQFPPLMGLDIILPGQEISHSSCVERIRRSRRFANIMERVFHDAGLEWMTRSGFYSREVMAFRALASYKDQSRDWLAALEYMEDKTDEDMVRFYQKTGMNDENIW